MRLILFLALSLPAAAQDAPSWRFRAGDRFTWECRSEYTFSSMRTRDGVTSRVTSPQVEALTVVADVESVGDDGAARLAFEVTALSIDAVWHDTGMRARWDSKEDKDVVAGFVRYAAIVGHRFRALIAADGAIRELDGGEWPKDRDLPRKKRTSQGEEKAADTARDPTPARTWLELMFATTPRREAAWEKLLVVPAPEAFAFAADGRDKAGPHDCARTKFGTRAKAEDGKEVPVENRKKGRSWWSGRMGAVVKAEVEGREEAVRYRPGEYGEVRAEVEMKKREGR
ncbi:MAG: hypothetical protein HYY18_06625 [Planctomycetes bacterium]|nr:hypothetical protein [Planctomycetota bacterium]